MKLDRQLILKFRDKMNEPEIYSIYYDHNGRAEWNVICSAMDWIETAIDGIDTDTLSGDNSSEASIKMLTFVSCVDLLVEGIYQLHRVFVDRNSVPFSDDKSVFNAHCEDRVYFKTIRAIFAAHPVKLKNVYGGGNDECWFASWSGGTFSKEDFGVFLYSNKPGVASRSFDIRNKEVFAFAKKRYEYLNNLIEAADKEIEKYKDIWRNVAIVADESNILEWISILLNENKRRGNYDFIEYDLEIARVAFLTEPACEMNRIVLEAYRKALIPELQQIQTALQTMEFEHIEEIEGNYPYELHYPASKLFSGDDVLFWWGVDRVQEYLNGVVELREQSSIAEIQAIARAGFWYKATHGV